MIGLNVPFHIGGSKRRIALGEGAQLGRRHGKQPVLRKYSSAIDALPHRLPLAIERYRVLTS